MIGNLDLKKALISGVVYYVITFIVASAAMMLFATGSMEMSAIMWVEAIIVMFLLANYYYFTAKPKSFLMEGLVFGIVVAIIALVLEIIVLVYAMGAGWEMYSSWEGFQKAHSSTILKSSPWMVGNWCALQVRMLLLFLMKMGRLWCSCPQNR